MTPRGAALTLRAINPRSIQPNRLPGLTLDDGIAQFADPLDGDTDDVAVPEEPRWIEACADPGRGARCEDCPGLERECCRQVLDHLAQAEDEVRRPRILA